MSEFDSKIKLSDEYYLGSDGRDNFILYEIYNKREGKGKHSPFTGEQGLQEVGYYGTLKGVASGLTRNKVLKDKVEQLFDYVDMIKELEQQIRVNLEQALPKIPKEAGKF